MSLLLKLFFFFFKAILLVKTKVSKLPLTYVPQLERNNARELQSTFLSSLSQNPTCLAEARL